MQTYLDAPRAIVADLIGMVETVAALPATLTRAATDLTATLAALQDRLAALEAQVERLGSRLDAATVPLGRLVDEVPPLAATIAAARDDLSAVNDALQATTAEVRLFRTIVQPIDAVGKRVADQLRRVTGRAAPERK